MALKKTLTHKNSRLYVGRSPTRDTNNDEKSLNNSEVTNIPQRADTVKSTLGLYLLHSRH